MEKRIVRVVALLLVLVTFLMTFSAFAEVANGSKVTFRVNKKSVSVKVGKSVKIRCRFTSSAPSGARFCVSYPSNLVSVRFPGYTAIITGKKTGKGTLTFYVVSGSNSAISRKIYVPVSVKSR